MRLPRILITVLLAGPLLGACAVHEHRDAPAYHAYKAAHPHARFVVVHSRPAAHRTCWKIARGWRCVAR